MNGKKEITINKKIINLFLLLLFSLVFFAFIFNNSKYSGAVIFSFWINGLLGILMLSKAFNDYPYSFFSVQAIFFTIFYFVCGLIQYLLNNYPWNYHPSNQKVLIINFIVFIWGVIYYLFYLFGEKTKQRKTILYVHPTRLYIWFITVIAIVLSIRLIMTIGLHNMIFKQTYTMAETYGEHINSFLLKATKTCCSYSLVYTYKSFKEKKDCLLCLIANFICFIIVCNPFGIGRYELGIYYFGVLLVCFPYFSKNRKAIILFLVGLLVIFPLMSATKNVPIFELNILETLKRLITNFGNNFTNVDYDAHSMIGWTYDYVKYVGTTHGRSLLTCILFLIPRSIWAGKMPHSGELVFKYFHKVFYNVSSPLAAEGFINFGYFGVILFAAFFGYITAKLDKKYWYDLSKTNDNVSLLKNIYPFVIFAFFFMSRGALLPTLNFMSVYIVVGIIYFLLCGVFNNIKIYK